MDSELREKCVRFTMSIFLNLYFVLEFFVNTRELQKSEYRFVEEVGLKCLSFLKHK